MKPWCVIVWAVVTPDLEAALKADLLEAGMALEDLPDDCDLHVHVNIVDARTGTTVLWPQPASVPEDANTWPRGPELPEHVHTQAELVDLLSDAPCWNEDDRQRFLVLWGHGVRAFPAPGRSSSVPSAAEVVVATRTLALPDVVGYDACWMANVETVNTLAADIPGAVFIGSMVPEPISGWPYAELIRILCAGGSPKAVAAAVVQAYAASLSVPDWCMVALDLKAVSTSGSGLTAALTALMVTPSPPAPIDFFAAADGADILEDTNLVDLGALMRRLQVPVARQDAVDVGAALSQAIVARRAAGSLRGRDGLAIRVGVPWGRGAPADPPWPLPPALPGWTDYFPEV